MQIVEAFKSVMAFLFKPSSDIEEDTGFTSSPLEGFYYCPLNTDGLVELTREERIDYAVNVNGMYILLMEPKDSIDMTCALDNMRIPTHRSA